MKYIWLLLFVVSIGNAQENVHFKKEITTDSIHLNLVNTMYGPFEVKIKVNDSLSNKVKVKEYSVLAARDTLQKAISFPLEIVNDTSSMRYTDYAAADLMLGNPNAVHNDDYEYALPYPKGAKYKIVQGFNGSFTHNSGRSRYAIDFNLRVGDTINAAREGIVVRIKDDSKEHGGKKFINKANLITILHDDGTMAAYVHLDYKGVLVKPGDTIKRGQPIGISGLTGFTRGPHLHFVVRKGKNVSIPIYFKGYNKKYLKKGKNYKNKSE